jgi:hypothetical protein
MEMPYKTPAEELKKKQVLELSSREAAKWGITAALLFGAGSFLATKKSPKFNSLTNMSVKWAIPVMAGSAAWLFRYENVVRKARARPEQYGIGSDVKKTERFQSKLPYHQQAMNYVYDHPSHLVGGLSVPLAGIIFYSQRNHSHLKFSQKLMHSRIFIAGGILTILMATMGFQSFMDNRGGRFLEPETLPLSDEDEKRFYCFVE